MACAMLAHELTILKQKKLNNNNNNNLNFLFCLKILKLGLKGVVATFVLGATIGMAWYVPAST